MQHVKLLKQHETHMATFGKLKLES